ncbi:MAG: thioredoxin family protein [Bacteroidales bacterium]|nr:thioredoxin family protein [Bacteroidales bacterium]
MLQLDFRNFEKHISKGLTIVKFTASWCAPCRSMDPIMNEVEDMAGNYFTVAVVDIDDNKSIAEKQGVFSIPMLIVYRDGVILRRFAGVQPASKIITSLKQYITL